MARKNDFRQRVSERTRRIVGEARARAEHQPRDEHRRYDSEPSILERLAGRLPERFRARVRDLMGPDPKVDQGRALLTAARDRMTDVRNREAALEAARRQLSKRERKHEEDLFELRAARAELETLRGEADRVASTARVETRIPLGEIEVDESLNPRPLRGINRLAKNIKRFGQLTPVVVRPTEAGYALVTGYRRMAALRVADITHAVCRVVPDLDDETAAALCTVENCFVDGVSSNAVRHLADRLADNEVYVGILELILEDDEAVVEDIYLEDMVEETQHHLAEAAAWVSTLRPFWSDLGIEERAQLEEFLIYFAKLSKRLKRR